MAQNDDYVTFSPISENKENIQEEHEILPVMKSIKEKREFVKNQASWSKLFKERKVRATVGLLGFVSAVATTLALPMTNNYDGFLSPSLMIVGGLAWGSLMNKRDFFSTSSNPINFIGSSIKAVAGATVMAISQNPDMNWLAYMETGTFIKSMVLGGFVGSYLLSKSLSDIYTGLKWNTKHKEFQDKRKGKRIDAIENLKFDIYYEGKLATYKYEEPAERKAERERLEKAQRDEATRQKNETKERAQVFAKELMGQGFNKDLSNPEDTKMTTPVQALDNLRGFSENELSVTKPKSKIEIIKDEIDALRRDIPILSKEEVSERMKKIQEMQGALKKPKKTM